MLMVAKFRIVVDLGAETNIIFDKQYCKMTQLPPIPKLSQQTQDYLRARGYDGNKIYEANRLPDFAIPRTLTYNLTTVALVALGVAGLVITKRKGLFSTGFGLAIGTTFVMDYLHRREIDATTPLSIRSATTLEEELERHQELKQAYEIVSKEMDTKIAELESRKGQSLR